MPNMTQKELFDKLNYAEDVVSIEDVFKEFDSNLTPRAKSNLLLECAGVEYYDDINLETMSDIEKYVNEVTSFLTKSVHYPESKYI